MMKYFYTNPMARTYQYEYAMYLKTAELFGGIACDSRCLTTLRLYYADLVTESRLTHQPSYEKQYLLEEEVGQLLERDVLGKIDFPAMALCQAAVLVDREKDGSHTFIFTDGIYGFSLRLKMSGKGRPVRILVRSLSPREEAPGELIPMPESEEPAAEGSAA